VYLPGHSLELLWYARYVYRQQEEERRSQIVVVRLSLSPLATFPCDSLDLKGMEGKDPDKQKTAKEHK
jgi:hypothetical protein